MYVCPGGWADVDITLPNVVEPVNVLIFVAKCDPPEVGLAGTLGMALTSDEQYRYA